MAFCSLRLMVVVCRLHRDYRVFVSLERGCHEQASGVFAAILQQERRDVFDEEERSRDCAQCVHLDSSFALSCWYNLYSHLLHKKSWLEETALSNDKRSFTQDARTPIAITPVEQSLEKGRAPIAMTPVPGAEDRGRQPVSITPVQTAQPSTAQTGNSGSSGGSSNGGGSGNSTEKK